MFFRLDFGLIALTVMIFTRVSDVMVNFHGLPSIAKLFIPLLFFLILIRWFGVGETPKNWEQALVILVGFTFLGMLSLYYADYPERTQEALIDFFKDALILLIFVILLQTRKDLKAVVWALIVAGIFLGTITTYQYLSRSFDQAFLGFGQSSYDTVVSDGGGKDYRAGGPGLGANGFGRYLLLVIPLALSQIRYNPRQVLKFVAGWGFIVTILALVFTFSRGGFLGIVIALGYYYLKQPPRFRSLLILGLTSVIVLIFLPSQYTTRMLELTDFLPGNSEFALESNISFRGRLSENIVAWQMFLDNPIAGVGLNNYPELYQSYSQDLGLDPRGENRSPHNLYLEFLSELGVLGILWFLFLQWLSFRGLNQARRIFLSLDMGEYANLCYAMQAVLIGFLVTGIFLHIAHFRFFWLIYGLAIAIRNVAHNELVEKKSQSIPAAPQYQTQSIRA
jgi:O-antigen ligase